MSPEPEPVIVPQPVVGAVPVPPATTPVWALPGLVRGLRPVQWSKNLLVFVAPAAAGVLDHGTAAVQAAGAFGVFCAVASAVYLVNDVVDAEADRLHPDKCRRPVASGALAPGLALAAAAVLAPGAIAGAWFVGGAPLVAVVALYLAVSLAYSLRLKREPVLELAAVASGFVLRAVAGGVACHVRLSSWFLVVASFGALLVVTGKRAGEHDRLGSDRARHRQVLACYTRSFLRSVLVLSATVTVTAYCLWAFGHGGLLDRPATHPVWVELTVAPVTLGVLHVLRLVDAGRAGAPEELARRDRLLQVLGVVWFGLMAVGIYG